MTRPKGSKNKSWPENWLPLVRACGGTLGALAKVANVAVPTVARWRDGGKIHESHQAVLRALAAEKHVISPV